MEGRPLEHQTEPTEEAQPASAAADEGNAADEADEEGGAADDSEQAEPTAPRLPSIASDGQQNEGSRTEGPRRLPPGRFRARFAQLPRPTRIGAAFATAASVLVLAALVASGLGLEQWSLFGFASAPPALATPTLMPTATHVPTPSPTPDPNILRNNAMGCADGVPASSSRVLFGAKDYATGGAAPREVALTFDDGPTPYTSPPIFDYLEQSHTPATFFVVGQYVRAWPYLVQREWRDGFAIGVHTWDHPMMTRVSDVQMQHQFGDTLAAIHAAIGQNACIWFWRPPYGDFNAHVVQTAQSFGLTTIQWNADPADWSRPGVQEIVDRVLAQVRPGSIVAMHDAPAHREQTAAALPLIVAGLKARGLTPVTLPTLLADSHYPGVSLTPTGEEPPHRPVPDLGPSIKARSVG